MSPRELKFIQDAIRCSEEALSFIEGKSFKNFSEDRGLQLIIERELEIIGESFYRLRNENEALFDSIPNSQRIVGLRNFLAHGYDSIDYEVLFDITQNQLPNLLHLLKNLQP